MDKFRKKLKIRLLTQITGLICACAAFLFSFNLPKRTSDSDLVYAFEAGFETGIFASFVCLLVLLIIRTSAAIMKPERLKKMYIAETDERILFIRQKSGSVGMSIILYGLVLGTIVAGNLDYTVFFTLLGACMFVGLIQGFLKFYYWKKY